MKLILSTGGTGGHIFPALAVAEELRLAAPHAEILFVGGLYGPEGNLAKQAGLNFCGLPVRGILGRGYNALPAAWNMAKAVIKAGSLLKDFQPQAVAGFGGYASFAVVLAASLRAMPTLLHEQNAKPGLSNRVLAKFVRTICLSLPDTGNMFPAQKCVLTGNPIRAEIAALGNAKKTQGGKNLLVMGGSQGARAVNSLVIRSLSVLRDAGIAIVHQTGKSDYERVRAAWLAHGFSSEQIDGPRGMVRPFIDNVAEEYAKANLCLCRSGASTVAELAAAGIPSVLVPFPFATHNHQAENARALQSAGAALLYEEKELEDQDSSLNMGHILAELLNNSAKLQLMGKAACSQAKPLAAKEVARQILEIAGKGKAKTNE